MKIFGVDFTSRPSKRKPITCLPCTLAGGVLRAGDLASWSSFDAFENALAAPGPWLAGLDFPFGQARKFIETIGWPHAWHDYVAHAENLGRDGFRAALTAYKAEREFGDKEHRRVVDKAARSISPQKLYGVPVGLMFFEGAPRLLRSDVTIPNLKLGDPERVVVEAYPGVLARSLVGNRSYKTDTRKLQTPAQHEARRAILDRLRVRAREVYGFDVDAPDHLCDDPGADRLDALLCAVQAAWAWTQRDKGYGAPADVDPREGWIADPHVTAASEAG